MMDTERTAKLEIRVDSIKEDMTEVKNDIKEVHSRITTSNREIVDKIDDMQTRIEHRMNASSQISQEQHQAIRKDIVQDMAGIEQRVRSLEQWKWYVIGGAGVIGFLLAHITDFLKFVK